MNERTVAALLAFDPVRNPRAARVAVLAAWAVLSTASVGLALTRGGAGLRAALSVETMDAAAGSRILLVQNDSAWAWNRARLWVNDRYYAECLRVESHALWRISAEDLLDLELAPLALADP